MGLPNVFIKIGYKTYFTKHSLFVAFCMVKPFNFKSHQILEKKAAWSALEFRSWKLLSHFWFYKFLTQHYCYLYVKSRTYFTKHSLFVAFCMVKPFDFKSHQMLEKKAAWSVLGFRRREVSSHFWRVFKRCWKFDIWKWHKHKC